MRTTVTDKKVNVKVLNFGIKNFPSCRAQKEISGIFVVRFSHNRKISLLKCKCFTLSFLYLCKDWPQATPYRGTKTKIKIQIFI